jgi:hypothetical protein
MQTYVADHIEYEITVDLLYEIIVPRYNSDSLLIHS